MKPSLSLLFGALAITGCSTIDDVVAYGKGPFDESPASSSRAALEGLHESSWGNSGKWGGQASDGDESSDTQDESDPPISDPPK